MNSEEEKELINYLQSLGFSGEPFERDLRQKIGLDTPNFRLTHSVSYGEEKMLFDLRFIKDHQFNAYRLDGYQATLRRAPVVENLDINGINTGRLEQSFRAIDWDKYFNDREGRLTSAENEEARSVLRDLLQLTTKPSEKGSEVQNLLQYKYWPEHAWDDAVRNLKRIHEVGGSFTASEYGCCNTDLAYNIISGKLGDLHEKLSSLEIEQYPGIDLYARLEKILSGMPNEMELKFERNEPEGYIEYIIPVQLIDGWYSIDAYQAILTPHPPIEHGVYNGVDSKELEELMRKIDWHDDKQLFIFHENSEPEFKPKVGDVQEQMYRLSQDMAGADIADRLQLKYWSDATFFSDMLQQSAWDELDNLPKRSQHFPVELKAKSAFNLLCSRAAMQINIDPVSPETAKWTRLDFTTRIAADGDYKTDVIDGFNLIELEDVLDILPIPNQNYYQIRTSLLCGDLTPATFQNDSKVIIEANPEERTLNIYTPDMKPILVNLRFDPDWQPGVQQKQEEQQQKQAPHKYKMARPVKRNKGKGL